MTPQDKANQLIKQFQVYVDCEIADDSGFVYSYEEEIKNSKKCSLIVVQEIIKSLTDYGSDSGEIQNMNREFE